MPLQDLSVQLQKVISKKQEEKEAEDRASFATMIGIHITENLQPVLEDIGKKIEALGMITNAGNQGVTESIRGLPAPQVTVNVPDIVVPEVKVPQVNVPEIKVPEAKVIVEIPEVKVPKPEVTVNVPQIKIPKIEVPEPKVTVNVPKQEFPEFPTSMSVGLENITRDYPLPVIMVGPTGKPMSFGGGGVSGGKSDFFTIKSIEGHKTFGAGRQTVTTAGTRVQLSSTSVSCKEVTIMSETDNTGLIAVGNNEVVAAEGSQKGIILLSGGSSVVLKVNNLNMIYIDSTVNGDGVTYAYLA